MRLRWARALGRGLWGDPKITRTLWQRGGRPAGDPASSAWSDPSDDLSDDPSHPPSSPIPPSSSSSSNGAESAALRREPKAQRGREAGPEAPRSGPKAQKGGPEDQRSGPKDLTSGPEAQRGGHKHQWSDPESQRDSESPEKGPEAFAAALAVLEQAPGRRVGRLELVAAALAAMPALGVARDREAYNRLLRLLPRGPWVPRNAIQRMLGPFPQQQECGLQIVEQMEYYGVIPDAETRFLLLGIFGPKSRPVRKCQRMLYWLPRFRHLDPHPVPPRLPPPGLPLAHLALRRIAHDLDACVTVFQHPVPDEEVTGSPVKPFIIGSQSPDQQEMLAQYGPDRPVYVEGPFPIWLRNSRLSYFVLRGDPLPPELREPPPDPERSFYYPLQLDLDLDRGPWDDDDFDVDEVEEGPIFALCMVGGGDLRRALGHWVRGLQETNPVLAQTPVIFRLEGQAVGDPPTPELEAGTPPSPQLEEGE